MGQLTMKEKEQWNERMSNKITKAVEQLVEMHEPDYFDRIDKEADRIVCESFGLTDQRAELARQAAECERLTEELRRAESERKTTVFHMLKTLAKTQEDRAEFRRVAGEYELEARIEFEKAKRRPKLMADDGLGRRILELQSEQEQMIDTILLATTSKQLRELWVTVSQRLEQPLTAFQSKLVEVTPPTSEVK